MAVRLEATVSRGANMGKVLRPHRYEDGYYVVSRTRFEADYQKVWNEDELAEHVKQGLKVRMSAPGIVPSLVSPQSIRRVA